jgi:hypothetical protein
MRGNQRFIQLSIIAKTAILAAIGVSITIRWVPSHIRIEGNK